MRRPSMPCSEQMLFHTGKRPHAGATGFLRVFRDAVRGHRYRDPMRRSRGLRKRAIVQRNEHRLCMRAFSDYGRDRLWRPAELPGETAVLRAAAVGHGEHRMRRFMRLQSGEVPRSVHQEHRLPVRQPDLRARRDPYRLSALPVSAGTLEGACREETRCARCRRLRGDEDFEVEPAALGSAGCWV